MARDAPDTERNKREGNEQWEGARRAVTMSNEQIAMCNEEARDAL